MMRWIIALSCTLVTAAYADPTRSACPAPDPCLTQTDPSPRGRITCFTRDARRLASCDGAADLAQAFGTLRAWIAEASARQVAKDTKGTAETLERVVAQHRLVAALLDKVIAARRATDARSTADERRKAAAAAHLEVARREDARRRLELKVSKQP